ncbi:MAG: alanine--tRNA ligase [Candidatus Colwellbacteria bacterium]|nr:alanine--tRNA ligase [Candidatus Colwellbacteria bacterium]
MQSEEIREKFIKFFESKGHKAVPSSSLLPTDPSVLLTTAGVQQFKLYYTGAADAMHDFGSLNTVSVQKSFRTTDIDEVGDGTHLTFFEMMGNFSFGGYFKKEAIEYAYELVTREFGLKIDYVTVFRGDQDVPEDTETQKIWKEIDPTIEIKKMGREDNFWGPTGNEGPCGPTTEIFVNGIEIWNLVFNEFYSHKDGKLEKLKTPGVDTGSSLERVVAVIEGKDHIFDTDLLLPIAGKIKDLAPDLDERMVRIFADHLRSSCFLIADGVRPSNKEAGYILRRLIRRVIAYEVQLDIHGDLLSEVPLVVTEKFHKIYPNLHKEEIIEVLGLEKKKFKAALSRGLKELAGKEKLTTQDAFFLYETYGLPFELIVEMAPGDLGKKLDRADFDKEFEKHQETSRAGKERKFGGHGMLLDTGELKAADEEELKKVTRLHTATHLIQAALKKVLGDSVSQRGSDITAERTRFDFTFDRKLTDEEILKVENLVNEVVKKDLPFQYEEMALDEAKKSGALFFYKGKYPPKVKVYYSGNSIEDAFSKELCGGPHVTHTGEVGKLKIGKQEAVAEGVRRLRASVE